MTDSRVTHTLKKPIVGRYLVAVKYCKTIFFALPFVLVASSSQAQTSLTLIEAIERSLSSHPDIPAMQFRERAIQGKIQQASVGTSSELMLTVENALGSGEYQGFDNAQTTLSISWILQGGLIDDRVRATKGEVSLLEIENTIRQFDIAAQTAREFVQLLALQERQKSEARSLQNAKTAFADIARKVDAGKLPISDRLRAEVNVQNRLLAVEDIEHEIASAQRLLAAQWGEFQFNFSYAAGDVTNLPQLRSFASLENNLEHNPETQWFLTQERVLEAEIALVKSEARRRLRFNTGIRHYQSTDDFSAVLTMSFPLGGEKRNQGKVASIKADQNRMQSEVAASRVALKAKLFALHQELQHSRHIVSTLVNTILPKLELAEKDIRAGFQLGRYSYSEWSIVQNELVEAHLRVIETSVVAHMNAIEIERLTGQSLSVFNQNPQ